MSAENFIYFYEYQTVADSVSVCVCVCGHGGFCRMSVILAEPTQTYCPQTQVSIIVLFSDNLRFFKPGFCGVFCSVNAGSNKAATSATGLNTKKLDDETEVLARRSFHPTSCGCPPFIDKCS